MSLFSRKIEIPRGVNEYLEKLNMSDIYCTDSLNMVPFGTHWAARGGQTDYNSTKISGKVLDMHAYVGSDNSNYLLYGAQDEVRRVTDSAFTSLATLPGAASKGNFVPKNKEVVYFNDNRNIVVDPVNGTNRKLGLNLPPVIANTAIGDNQDSTSALTGGSSYRYAIQYLNKDSSGNIIDRSGAKIPQFGISGTITLGSLNSSVTISFRRVNDPDVTHFRLYRTRGNTATNVSEGFINTDFYFLTDIANDNATYKDTLPDEALDADNKESLSGENDLLQEFYMTPLPAGIGACAGQRLFSASAETLYYSHNNGKSWMGICGSSDEGSILYDNSGAVSSVSGKQQTPNGQNITALATLGQHLYVFTANRTFLIRNAGDAVVGQMEEVPEDFGTLSNNTVLDIDGALLVLTNEPMQHGIRILDGGVYLEDIVDRAYQTQIEAITDYSTAYFIKHKDEIWLGHNDDSDKNYNNKVICIKKVLGRWRYYKNDISFNAGATLSNGATITYNDSRRTFVQQDSGSQDFGANFTGRIKFKPITGRDAGNILQMIGGKLLCRMASYVDMRYYIDEDVFAGGVRIPEPDQQFASYESATWAHHDEMNGTEGRASLTTNDMWGFKFDDDAFGNIVEIEAIWKENSAYLFKGLVLDGYERQVINASV